MDYLKCRFVKDEHNARLKEVFVNNTKLKEVHIDIYPSNPLQPLMTFMLLLRTHENNVLISNDGNRLVLKKNDRYKTNFLNILLSEVEECFYNVYENYLEFIIKVQNIYYKLTILN